MSDEPRSGSGLSLEARMAVVEAGFAQVRDEHRYDRAQQAREHRENQAVLAVISKGVSDAGAQLVNVIAQQTKHDVRIDSLEKTRDEQTGVLKLVRILATVAALAASVAAILAVVHP